MDLYYLGGITFAGISSGLLAGLVGGGAEIIIVPLLTMFGLLGSLKHRIGTTLFMLLPPVGLFATLRYYNKGYVDLKASLYMALLFTVFASVSAKYSSELDPQTLKNLWYFYNNIWILYL